MVTPKRLRTVLRTVHIVLSLALGVSVYAPVEEVGDLRLVLQIIVFPAAAITGFWMWQQRRVSRWLGRARRKVGLAGTSATNE